MSKFLFHTAFDRPGSRPGMPPARDEDVEAAVVAARTEGYAQGMADARRELAGEVAAGVQKLTQQMEQVIATCISRVADNQAHAVRLAHSLAAKLAPTLMRQRPVAEVEAMLTDILRDHGDEPRVVVRAPEPVIEELKPKLDAIVAGQGYAGAVILLPDDRMKATDCRVEWADGGAERTEQALAASIDAVIQRHLQMNAN